MQSNSTADILFWWERLYVCEVTLSGKLLCCVEELIYCEYRLNSLPCLLLLHSLPFLTSMFHRCPALLSVCVCVCVC